MHLDPRSSVGAHLHAALYSVFPSSGVHRSETLICLAGYRDALIVDVDSHEVMYVFIKPWKLQPGQRDAAAI